LKILPGISNIKDRKQQNHTKTPEINKEDVNCIKCNRLCRTKASYCDLGRHWVHYNCEKLDTKEIIAVEKKNTSKHDCKICKAKPISNDQTPNCGIMEVVQRRVNLAKSMLDEEQNITSPTNDTCNMCMNIFNKKNIKYNDRGPICFSCEGLLDQKQESESRGLNTASEENGLKKSVNIVNGDIPYTEAKSLPSNYLVRHNSSSDIRHDGTIEKTVNTDQHTRDRKQNGTTNNNQCKDNHDNTIVNTKMNELRQKEIKLLKWEDDMKIKEKLIQDNSKDIIRMETYIKQLESEKEEHEQTIRTLKRKIVNLEDNYTTRECNQEHMTTQSSHSSSALLDNIYKKVTNYILKQVDVQLQKIENLENGSSLHRKEKDQTIENQQNVYGTNIVTTQDAQKDTELINREKRQVHVDNRTTQGMHVFVPKGTLPIHLTGSNLNYVPIPLQQLEHQIYQPTYQNRIPYQNGSDNIQRCRQPYPENSRWARSNWKRNQNDNRYPHIEQNRRNESSHIKQNPQFLEESLNQMDLK